LTTLPWRSSRAPSPEQGFSSTVKARVRDRRVDGASLAADFTNKRHELKSKLLSEKENVPSAADMLGANISFEQIKGKRLFGARDR
jgi:hypothetical protein